MSQFSDAGTGSDPGGTGVMSPHVLLQKVWTSFTLPITPWRSISSVASCVGWEEIWIPICDTRRLSRAAAASMRVSCTVVASGFCT